MNTLPPSDGPIGIPPEVRSSLGLHATPSEPTSGPPSSPVKKTQSMAKIAGRVLFGVAAIGVFAISRGTSEKAGNFNDTLINAQEASLDESTPIMESIGTASTEDIAARMTVYAAENQKRIAALEALDASGIKGGESFRAKTVQLIRGYDTCFGSFIPEMAGLADTFETEDQVRTKGDELFQQYCGSIEPIEQALLALQTQFAKDNNITLQ